MRSAALISVLLLALIALASTAQIYVRQPENANQGATDKSVAGGAPLTYNGGPLITTTFTINYIWYGAWDPSGLGVSIAQNFAQNIDTTDWYRPIELLKDANGTRVTGTVKFGTSIFDTSSLGLRLTQADINTIVTNTIKAGKLAYDPNSLTLVITAPDIYVQGYCNGQQHDNCGYHTTDDTLPQGLIQLGFIGAKSLCGCSPANGPYGEALDGMMDTIAHEIIETASDPHPPTGWINDNEQDTSENGDKCANKYENLASFGNGAFYNVIVGTTKYIIQPNYNVDTNTCDTPCVPDAVGLPDSNCPTVVSIPGVTPPSPVPAPPRPSPTTGQCIATTQAACTAITGCKWKNAGRCQFNCKSLTVAAGAAACTAKGCRFNPKKGCRQPF